MENNLIKQLQELIAANLPLQVGETLRNRLEQLEHTEREFKEVESRNKELLEKVIELEGNIKKLLDTILNLEKYKDKAEKTDEKEKGLDITIANIKIEEAEKRANLAKDFLYAVFKNPTFKTVSQHNTNHMRDHQGTFGSTTVVEERTIQEEN